jgi:hypothetical protein
MRRKHRLIGLLCLTSCLWCCSPNETLQKLENDQQIPVFQIKVRNSDYSMGDNWIYVLTERDLKIIYREDVVGSKDTVLFTKTLAGSDTLRKISRIDFSQLHGSYSNSCMSDGSQITVQVIKGSDTTAAHLANYYRAEVGQLIALLNSLAPDKYRIWYEKKALIALEKECAEKR